MKTRLMRQTLLILPVLMAACAPTVKLQAPDKPIEINLNVKIEQDVRIRVEKGLENDIAKNPELFGLPAATPLKKGK